MFKKFVSMATAAFLLTTGITFLSTTQAKGVSATFTINCSDTTALTVADGWEVVTSMGQRYATNGAGFQKFLVLNPSDAYTFSVTNCGNIVSTLPANSTSGTIALTGANVNNGSSTNASVSSGFSSYSITATAGSTIPTLPISGGGSNGRNTLTFQTNQGAQSTIAITFIDAATGANADLSQLTNSGGQSFSNFSSSTTTYSVTTARDVFTSTRTVASIFNQPVARSCNGTSMTDGDFNCPLNLGANTFTASITGLDGVTTKVYTVNITRNVAVAPIIASVSTISILQVNPVLTITSSSGSFNSFYFDWTVNLGTTGLVRGTASISGSTLTLPLLGNALAGTVTVQAGAGSFSPPADLSSNTLSFTVGSSSPSPSTPTLSAAQIAANAAAAAKAAAEAAAAVRAAEVAAAQTKLSTVLKADKAGTIDEYKSANINISTTASLARINAEVLKLSANDRSDFAKIKAIADRIEFDESFFNTTARPTLSTYTKYEVVGVTERILPTINTKVLELPATLRVDAKAIQDLVKVESFVDRVANKETRSTVTSAALVSRGLLTADYPRRHSVVNGLAGYPEGSLNTMAKIEAAIKEQIEKAEASKRRTAEIKAKIAARNK